MEMLRQLAVLYVLMGSLSIAYGWWFFGREEERVQAVCAVDGDCLRDGELGSCRFYTCLERRFPCGRNSYAVTHGGYYCNKFQSYIHMFNEQGRRWVQNTRQCMTRNLRSTYQSEELTCKAISQEGFRTLSDCFVSRGFCNIAWDNREALLKVFEIKDLFDSYEAIRVWREILDIARGCTGHNVERFLEWALGTSLPLHGK